MENNLAYVKPHSSQQKTIDVWVVNTVLTQKIMVLRSGPTLTSVAFIFIVIIICNFEPGPMF